MKASNNTLVQIQFYGSYIQDQDAFSASWLSKYGNASFIVYADSGSSFNVLAASALIPTNLMFPLTNATTPARSSYIYFDSLNVVKDLIPSSTGAFNSSELSSSIGVSNLIYSNGDSQVWGATGSD
jgi:uncharacterized membrane protein